MGPREGEVGLNHASVDGGETAVCGKVKTGHLCDQIEPELTCKACIRKLARTVR